MNNPPHTHTRQGSGSQLHSDVIWKGESLHRAWVKVCTAQGMRVC